MYNENYYKDKEEREKYKIKGQAALKKFLINYLKTGGSEIMFLEKKFSFKIGADIIKGTIDRVDKLADGTLEIIDYNEHQAFLTGELRTVSKAFGLSLGDRACLALSIIKKLPILTADRVWSNVPVQTQVQVIRE